MLTELTIYYSSWTYLNISSNFKFKFTVIRNKKCLVEFISNIFQRSKVLII